MDRHYHARQGSPTGKKHPITQTFEEIIRIFSSLGFSVAEGPDIELEYYNFEALNIPKDHPARDMQDTFYVKPGIVLRTHTSPVQIRVMESQLPPVKIIAPGSVYRCDHDVSHTPMFHQVEGLMVDKRVRFSDLKGILTMFIQEMFGSDDAAPVQAKLFSLYRALCRGGHGLRHLWWRTAAGCARRRAGSRYSVPAWFTPRCCGMWGMIRKK